MWWVILINKSSTVSIYYLYFKTHPQGTNICLAIIGWGVPDKQFRVLSTLHLFGSWQLSLLWPHPPCADLIWWVLNLDSPVSVAARFWVLPLSKLNLVWLHMCTTGKEITFPWLSTQLPIRPQGAFLHPLEALTLIYSSACIQCMKIKILYKEKGITIIYVHGMKTVLL